MALYLQCLRKWKPVKSFCQYQVTFCKDNGDLPLWWGQNKGSTDHGIPLGAFSGDDVGHPLTNVGGMIGNPL